MIFDHIWVIKMATENENVHAHFIDFDCLLTLIYCMLKKTIRFDNAEFLFNQIFHMTPKLN